MRRPCDGLVGGAYRQLMRTGCSIADGFQSPPRRLGCAMDLDFSAPGISAALEGDDLVIRIRRESTSPLISILLHSKFSDGPRMEFLTNPYVNVLLEALMAADGTTGYMAGREGMTQALAPIIAFVDAWTKQKGMQADETATLLRTAIYPYSLT